MAEKEAPKEEQKPQETKVQNTGFSLIGNTALGITVSAIVSVAALSALVLGIINFGMNVQRNIDSDNNAKAEKEKVLDVIGVDYEATSFTYTFGAGYGTKEEVAAQPKNRLFYKMGISEDSNYYVIDSNNKLSDVVAALRTFNSKATYTVDSNYFSSSSVILVNYEGYNDLDELEVMSVSRDENYNIQIDVKPVAGGAGVMDGVVGGVAFIKVKNIQPKSVTVNVIEDDD